MNDNLERKPLILVIDDEVLFTKSMQLILKGDYKCLIANNGEQALERLKENQPDLVLCDIKMDSSINGYELCQKIKQIDHLVPVIFLSNFNDQASRQLGLAQGADDFIGKTEIDELLVKIKNTLVSRGKIPYSSIQFDTETLNNMSFEGADFINILTTALDELMDEKSTEINSVSLDTISKKLHMSKSTFQRRLLRQTSESFTRFKHKYLMNYAVNLLSENNKISDIAQILGFHFSAVFKDMYGLPPRQYRLNKKNT